MLPKPVDALIARAQAIAAGMTANPHFPAPIPAVWVITQAVTNLQRAQTQALTRAKGTARGRQ